MANVKITELVSGSALTGTELFESVQAASSVKLTATQVKDFVLDLGYGSFYDTTDQSATASTATPIKYGTVDLSSGITVANDGIGNKTFITFATSGVYDVSTSLQFANADSSNHAVKVWLKKNGADIANSASTFKVPKLADGGVVVFEINLVLSLSAGDIIQYVWATPNTAVTLDYTAPTVSPYVSPAVPSAIFVATQLK